MACWARVCRGLDCEDLTADPRFASEEARHRNRRPLIRLLDGAIKQRSASDWMERWSAIGVVASPVCTLADLAEDPQAWENRYFVETYCEEVQRQVKVRGLPVHLGKTPGSVRCLGPELGQHTEEILVETLGYSWEQVGELKEQGVIP